MGVARRAKVTFDTAVDEIARTSIRESCTQSSLRRLHDRVNCTRLVPKIDTTDYTP